jgi:hypothetical protein
MMLVYLIRFMRGLDWFDRVLFVVLVLIAVEYLR